MNHLNEPDEDGCATVLPRLLPCRAPRLTGGAAQRAAILANDECERLCGKRPFTAEQHRAAWVADQYRWGGLDEGGAGGFSALVVLGTDGSPRTVEVYFSTDVLMPTFILLPDSERAQPGRR